MLGAISVLAQETVSDKKDLYPQASELIVGAIAFAILFYFMWKWVVPRVNTLLEERRAQIQGQLEAAEQTRQQAERELAEYRKQLANARDEANRIIEEARETAEQFRRDIQAKAEEESRNIVARAQDEIRAERDRVFNELRAQVADIAVTLAGRVVGAELDTKSHERLIDEYIEQVASGANGKGG
ncbi:MAG: F0F1 ATP synthase subunit B [Actinomycetota bacterium]|nr:F0F1 ATP synthase subunit B [Actinomycetota bacterium]